MSRTSRTSDQVQIHEQGLSRPQVIRYYVSMAINRRGLLFKQYVETVVQHYNATVWEQNRELKPFDVDSVKGLQAAHKRIQRIVHTPHGEYPLFIPSELEEALVEALPEPERSICAKVLCERYGFIPMEKPTETNRLADLGSFVKETGEAIHKLSEVLADNELSESELAQAHETRSELMDVVSTAMCLIRQFDEIESGKRP